MQKMQVLLLNCTGWCGLVQVCVSVCMCFHLQLSGKGVSHQHGEYPTALDTSGGNQCLWRADISIQRSCIFVFQDFRDDLQHKVHSSAQRTNDHKGIFHSHFLGPRHNPASLLQASPIPLFSFPP